LLNFDYWTIGNHTNKMIFVYVLIYMDFISELLFFIQDSVQISAVSHGHSGEVCTMAASPNMLNFSRFENAQSFHSKFIAEAVVTM